MLSYRLVRYFLAVVDAGKISGAAKVLNVSQSAITLAIRELEEELGVQLLDRARTGVSLTRRGQIFHQHALDIDAAFARAASSMRARITPSSNSLMLPFMPSSRRSFGRQGS